MGKWKCYSSLKVLLLLTLKSAGEAKQHLYRKGVSVTPGLAQLNSLLTAKGHGQCWYPCHLLGLPWDSVEMSAVTEFWEFDRRCKVRPSYPLPAFSSERKRRGVGALAAWQAVAGETPAAFPSLFPLSRGPPLPSRTIVCSSDMTAV